MRIYHDNLGHGGVDKTLQGIISHYWFPNLKIRIRQYIDHCVKYLTYSVTAGKAEGELEIFAKEKILCHILHVDHFGPLEASENGYKHILVIIDAFTKFVWLFPTKSTGEIVTCFNLIFHLFGFPRRIISDRGTGFTSHNFAKFVSEKNIKHILTAVASPWANEQVERVNRFLKSTLSKMVDKPSDWKVSLGLIQFIINNTFNKAIELTPSKLLLGFDKRNASDEELRSLIDAVREVDENYEIERKMAQDKVVNRKLQEYNKVKYDKRHKKCTKYSVGDLVMVKMLPNKPGTNRKLQPKFKGPYRIKAVLNNRRFVVTDVPGFNLKQRPYNTILSADKLKPWIRINKAIDGEEI